MPTESNHILIIGMGLIGASMAAALKKQDSSCVICGIDVLEESVAKAHDNGWIDCGGTPDSGMLEAFIEKGCGLVVLATPASVASLYFDALQACGYSGIITDTASTKTPICHDAAEHMSDTSRYVPGHPMAGSEKNGVEGARVDLFEGAHWILCPDEHTNPDDYAFLHELFTGLGARVISLPRQIHDESVAVVSHVPHIVASSLVELARRHTDDSGALFRLAAGGFKDSTRIAAGSSALWCGIAFDNRSALKQGLDEMRGIIGSFEEALDNNDRAAMTQLLEQSAQTRRALPAAWVPSTDNLLEVRIPMQDRKGVVAEATTIASKVGCNIQSIEIDHITADSAVLSLILTDEGDIGKLSAQLIQAGFSVSFSPLTAKEHSHV